MVPVRQNMIRTAKEGHHGPARLADGAYTPVLRVRFPAGPFHFSARLAARKRTSRAQVETLSPAARLISSCSASESLSRKAGFLFSDSGIVGRPRFGVGIKVYPKISGWALQLDIKRIY